MEFIKQFDGFCCYNVRTNMVSESIWPVESDTMFAELSHLGMIKYPALELHTPDEDLILFAKKEGWEIIKVLVTVEKVK